MPKKAEGLTLSTIAIAAIVLVVVAVTIAIFTGAAEDFMPFFKQQKECSARGGDCTTLQACNDAEGTALLGIGCPGTLDKAEEEYCCIK
ncbi:hypothetical protein HYU12_02910 [Candidatus Woesearchaeota archaeon]|nr:hypothetical protein [Candidatus Woesearchaeota archaeon]